MCCVKGSQETLCILDVQVTRLVVNSLNMLLIRHHSMFTIHWTDAFTESFKVTNLNLFEAHRVSLYPRYRIPSMSL